MAVRSTIATKDGCNEYLYILIQLRLRSAYSPCSAGDRGPIRSNWSHVPTGSHFSIVTKRSAICCCPCWSGLPSAHSGHMERSLVADLRQGSASSYGRAILDGIVYNLANIRFMAAWISPAWLSPIPSPSVSRSWTVCSSTICSTPMGLRS